MVVHFVGSHYISSSNRVTDARSVVVNWDYGVVIVVVVWVFQEFVDNVGGNV